MITLTEIFVIIGVHWFADFVIQTDKQAKGKSKNWRDLLSHTGTYSLTWCLVICIISLYGNYIGKFSAQDIGWSHWLLMFPLVTFIAHTITDYFTSRINARLWAQGKVHLFFVSVGFDQVLHYVQLFMTYYLLK